MSMHKDLASLNHEDLVKLSSLVHRLLKWDSLMSWDEALQLAYDRVIEDSDWMKNQSLDDNFTRYC